jgi:DNA-binding SARP family transcriptional activator
MFALTLFGGLSLESDAGPLPPAALQRRRLALLALLAVAGERGMPREKVHAHLWPDRPDERARHALEQLLYLTRRDLGRDAVLGDGTALRLNPDVVTSDLARFDAAVARADWSAAAQAYAGPLLDGVRLGDAPGFERWADEQRGACARRYACALEHLAGAAERDGAHADAAEWWRRRAALDPYSVAAALGLMRALAATL